MNKSILSLINAQAGKVFTVTFVKKDGSVRTMNCRTGVYKNTKGGSNNLNPAQYITVYDMQQRSYRAVNVDTIMSVRAGGVEAAVAA